MSTNLPSRTFGQLHTNLQIKRREAGENLLPIGGNYRGVGKCKSKLFVRRMNLSSYRPANIIIIMNLLIACNVPNFQARPH